MPHRHAAEGLGSLPLDAIVLGSRIVAERLAGGSAGTGPLTNTAAGVNGLAAAIGLFGPVSGAHGNPAASLADALRGTLRWPDATGYVVVQSAGCCGGGELAHLTFGLPLVESAGHAHTGPAPWLA